VIDLFKNPVARVRTVQPWRFCPIRFERMIRFKYGGSIKCLMANLVAFGTR
jgi:hypothetical protein